MKRNKELFTRTKIIKPHIFSAKANKLVKPQAKHNINEGDLRSKVRLLQK